MYLRLTLTWIMEALLTIIIHYQIITLQITQRLQTITITHRALKINFTHHKNPALAFTLSKSTSTTTSHKQYKTKSKSTNHNPTNITNNPLLKNLPENPVKTKNWQTKTTTLTMHTNIRQINLEN
jgi:hypothetical protein